MVGETSLSKVLSKVSFIIRTETKTGSSFLIRMVPRASVRRVTNFVKMILNKSRQQNIYYGLIRFKSIEDSKRKPKYIALAIECDVSFENLSLSASSGLNQDSQCRLSPCISILICTYCHSRVLGQKGPLSPTYTARFTCPIPTNVNAIIDGTIPISICH